MTNPFRSLKSRLLVSYLAVCASGTTVLFLTVRLTAPGFFLHHIGAMPGMMGAAGMMTPEATLLDGALTRSLNQGFLIATAIGLPLGIIASVVVSQQIARPARRLAVASRRIAAGEYAERVPGGGPSELDELAGSFNAMAEALERVEQRRMELIGDVAHELRTPITVIHGYVEGLTDGVFPASPETWTKLAEETGRLTRLVEELQELSRAEAGQFVLTLLRVNPAEAVRTAAKRLEAAFAAAGLVLEAKPADDLPSVHVDVDRLVQILTNLLTNALKYTPPPGRITIDASQRDHGIAFSVRDSGIGISPDQLPHVFERFYRVDRSRARSSGGSGIGLTIAKAIAVALGGTLSAESAGPAQGSTFTLWLPVAS